jgi:hypothetical protein
LARLALVPAACATQTATASTNHCARAPINPRQQAGAAINVTLPSMKFVKQRARSTINLRQQLAGTVPRHVGIDETHQLCHQRTFGKNRRKEKKRKETKKEEKKRKEKKREEREKKKRRKEKKREEKRRKEKKKRRKRRK